MPWEQIDWQESKGSSAALAAPEQFDAQIMGINAVDIIKWSGFRDIQLILAKAIEEGNGIKALQDTILKIIDDVEEKHQREQSQTVELSSICTYKGRRTQCTTCGTRSYC